MHPNERSPINTHETEQKVTAVNLIYPDGFGFGKGEITIKKQLKDGTITKEVPEHVHEYLTKDTGAFVAIDPEATDDGCGDGRPWQKIIQETVDDNGNRVVVSFGKSLHRPKVFGGGLIVASSMWRSIMGKPSHDEDVGQDRKFMADALTRHRFSHGAHSDDHASDDNCGCGAIDKYPQITANAVEYRKEITNILSAIYGDSFTDSINEVFGVYKALAGSEDYFSGTSGKGSLE